MANEHDGEMAAGQAPDENWDRKCLTRSAAAFGLGVGSHWLALDFLAEALPVLLSELDTPSLRELTQIATGLDDDAFVKLKDDFLRREMVQDLADRALPASDPCHIWYVLGAGLGKRIDSLPNNPSLHQVVGAIRSGIAELPPELVAEVQMVRRLAAVQPDALSEDGLLAELFGAEADTIRGRCVRWLRRSRTGPCRQNWLDLAGIVLPRIQREIDRGVATGEPICQPEEQSGPHDAEEDTLGPWWHNEPPDPERYPLGPIEGTKRQIADWVAMNPKTLENWCRDGTYYVWRRAGQTWAIYFKTEGDYNNARRRASENAAER